LDGKKVWADAYLRLPGSITRTQCTGTVPKTSGEGDRWLDMEGGRGSSFRVELEWVDDKESLEALHEGEGGNISGQQTSLSQRNVHKGRQRCPHEAQIKSVEHGR
jgi:hypothetical protein